KANAFLLPEWEMNSQVMALNGAGGGGGGVDEDYNQPPVISFSGVSFSGPFASSLPSATVVASVSDDGIPKPRPPRRGSPPRGPLLRVAWLQFRGPVGGRGSFAPGTTPVVNGKAETVATFTMPGQYSLMGIAMDGSASGTATVTVNVTSRP